MKKVTVFWQDSRSYGNAWLTIEEMGDIITVSCETRGFVVKEDKHKIIVAQTEGGDQYHNLIAIPKRSIVSVDES